MCFFCCLFFAVFCICFCFVSSYFSLCWLLWSIDFYSVPNHLVPDTISFTVRRWKGTTFSLTLISRNPNHNILCMTASYDNLLETDFEPFGVLNSIKFQIAPKCRTSAHYILFPIATIDSDRFGTQSQFDNITSGGRLNKKDGLTRYEDSHVKDKTS